jgi:hypothetical protein
MELEFSPKDFRKILISNFMKFRPVGTVLFLADRYIDTQDEPNGRFTQFREQAYENRVFLNNAVCLYLRKQPECDQP